MELNVRELQWDEENEVHLFAHGVTRQNAQQVLQGRPRFFLNYPERQGSHDSRTSTELACHLMVGPAASGVFFVISIREVEGDGIWRPVTGWHVGERKGRRIYGN